MNPIRSLLFEASRFVAKPLKNSAIEARAGAVEALYQIDRSKIDSDEFEKLLENYKAEHQKIKDRFYNENISVIDSLYKGDMYEYWKADTLITKSTKESWFNAIKNNHQILKDFMDSDRFDKTPAFGKMRTTNMFTLHTNILNDMKESWRYGEMDLVV